MAKALRTFRLTHIFAVAFALEVLASVSHATTAPYVWSPVAPLATARAAHTATLLPSGKVLVVGGTADFSGGITSAEIYDPSNNVWSSAGSLSTGRFHHTATLLGSGQVLVVGGEGSSGAIASAELYDPSNNTWSSTSAMPVSRTLYTSTLLLSGRVLVTGGDDGGPGLSTNLYIPTTGAWEITASMATARYNHSATSLQSGAVLVVGGVGTGGDADYLASAEIYQPATNTWSAAGSLASARMRHRAVLLSSGKVLAAGGEGDTTIPFSVCPADAELYDPVSNGWSDGGALVTPRELAAATLLSTGQVLMAGGWDQNGLTISSAEVYDPTTNSWSAAASLPTASFELTLTLLPSGEVLAVGGFGNSALASAALYKSDDLFQNGFDE